MFEFLADPDPFDIHTVINLNSDEVADKSVNVFQTQVIGESLIQGMTLDYKFTKKEMCITIKINASLNIGDIVVKVDPQLFFQRIFVFIQHEEINDAFSYELCTRPSSLFEKKSLMNEAHKPALKSALFDQPGLSECIIPDINQDTHYDLDGGSWLQRLPWTVGDMFNEICQSFKNYLLNNYGTAENITVVFRI